MPASFVERADERMADRQRKKADRARARANAERARLLQQRRDERAASKARTAVDHAKSPRSRGALGISKIVGSGSASANDARRLGGQVKVPFITPWRVRTVNSFPLQASLAPSRPVDRGLRDKRTVRPVVPQAFSGAAPTVDDDVQVDLEEHFLQSLQELRTRAEPPPLLAFGSSTPRAPSTHGNSNHL